MATTVMFPGGLSYLDTLKWAEAFLCCGVQAGWLLGTYFWAAWTGASQGDLPHAARVGRELGWLGVGRGDATHEGRHFFLSSLNDFHL